AYKKFASTVGPHGLIESMHHLGDALNSMVYNTVDNRILFEVAMFKVIEVLKKYINKR
ncbi:MAG: hypothetical protein GX957_10220, partial [Clostridiaceae bacterium]|nr:hypothetical protein [Clostridiaceae bacterium]